MDKPVLLLLPGLMCDATVWRPQIDAFGSTYDVRVPDFFGLDSLEAMAKRALALVEGPFALAGHSMGGRVALQLSALADRVERIALLDTGVHPAPEGEAGKRQVLIDLGDTHGMGAVIEAWLPPMLSPARSRDPALWGQIAPMLQRAGLDVLKGQARALVGRPDATPYLDALACPTCFIVGEDDGWSPPRQHAEMQAHVPGSALTVIPDCGHMCTLERPAAVNQALRGWLES